MKNDDSIIVRRDERDERAAVRYPPRTCVDCRATYTPTAEHARRCTTCQVAKDFG